MYLQSYCLSTAVSADLTFPAFDRHATIYIYIVHGKGKFSLVPKHQTIKPCRCAEVKVGAF
jgi:hypothetical protein